MTGEALAAGAAPRGPVALWLALLAGPAAGSAQLSINYALVKWACAHGGEWALTVMAITLLAAALGGAALGAVQLSGIRDGDDAVPTWSAGSRRLLAATAVGVDVLVAIFLVNSLIAIAALTPCE